MDSIQFPRIDMKVSSLVIALKFEWVANQTAVACFSKNAFEKL